VSATRHVVSTFLTPDGAAWADAEVTFLLIPGSYTGTEQFPPAVVVGVTDEYGTLDVELWTNEIGAQACVYRCTLPHGPGAPNETFDFTLPAGASDIELSVLRLAGVTPYDPQYDTLVTWMLAQWKGAWDAGTAYGLGDKVFHGGSSYIATADTVAGQEPGVHASWDIINQGTLPIPLAYIEDYGAVGGYVRSTGLAWARVQGVAWGDLSGVPLTFAPTAHTHAPADLTGAGADGGYLRSNGAAWVRAQGVAWADLSGVPLTFAPAAHNHAWGDITSGVPLTFAPAAHNHAWADITSGLPGTWAPSAHTHPASEVTAGSFGTGDYTVTGKLTFAGTPTLADGTIGITAVNGLTLRAVDGSSYDFAVLTKTNGALALGIEGTTVTIPGDVTISTGRLYVQGTAAASIIDRALQVGNGGLTSASPRLDVQGTTTAATGVAYQFRVAGELVAAANNDVLRGAYIAPTFTPGVHTGVTLYGLEIGNVAGGATSYALKTGTGTVYHAGDTVLASAHNAIGIGAALGYIGLRITSSFTSDGGGNFVLGVDCDPTLTMAAGDDNYAAYFGVAGFGITTQGTGETIGHIAAARFSEPLITKVGADVISVAATVYIAGAPTEGVQNAALYVAAGAASFQGAVGIGLGNPVLAGLTMGQDRSIGWYQSATETIPNIFRQASSASLVFGNGVKYSATASAFASSYGSNWARSAVVVGSGIIGFYTQPAATVAPGTDVTMTERMRLLATGDLALAATAKVFWDGVAGTGNTYTHESAGDTLTTVVGGQPRVTLTTAGMGFGDIPTGFGLFCVGGAFTSDGANTWAAGMSVAPNITGAAGDTLFLAKINVSGTIVTQTASETITDVCTLRLKEPQITKNVTTITTASTLLIEDAPTEGAANFALFVKAGASKFGGDVTLAGGLISYGANDSAGAGYRFARVPNA
jgi:hypothetical protein